MNDTRQTIWGDQEKIIFVLSTVPAFFITMEFLIPTLPRYKAEAKKLKENTEEAACSETALKFSID